MKDRPSPPSGPTWVSMLELMRRTHRARVGLMRDALAGRIRTLMLPGQTTKYCLEDGLALAADPHAFTSTASA